MSVFMYYENIRNQGGLVKFTIGLRALDQKLWLRFYFCPAVYACLVQNSLLFLFLLVLYSEMSKHLVQLLEASTVCYQGWEYESCLCMSVSLLSTSNLYCKEILHHFRV